MTRRAEGCVHKGRGEKVTTMQEQEIRAAVSGAPLSRGLRQEEIDQILAICELIKLDAGSVVFRESEKSDALYLVLEGQINISKRVNEESDRVVATLTRQSMFGQSSLFTNGIRPETATANTDVQLVKIPSQRFRELLKAEEPAAFKVVSNVALSVTRRLSDLNEKLVKLIEETETRPRSEDLAEFRIKIQDWGF